MEARNDRGVALTDGAPAEASVLELICGGSEAEPVLLATFYEVGEIQAIDERADVAPGFSLIDGEGDGAYEVGARRAMKQEAVGGAFVVDAPGLIVRRRRGDDIGGLELEGHAVAGVIDECLTVGAGGEIGGVVIDGVGVARLAGMPAGAGF